MADRTRDVEDRLTELAHRVYERYGTDLSAYFRTIEEAEREKQKYQRDEEEAFGACLKRHGTQHGEEKSQLPRESESMYLHQR